MGKSILKKTNVRLARRGGSLYYIQKSSGWFKSSLFCLDDNIKWYGNGVAAIISEELRAEILAKYEKN